MLIEKKDAIKAICEACYMYKYIGEHYRECKYYPCDDIKALEAIPSADAEQVTGKLKKPCGSLLTEESNGSKEQKSKLDGDIISRADAIEAVRKEYEDAVNIGDNGDAVVYDVERILSALPSAEAEWIPFRDDLLIRENAAEAVGEFFNKMDISLFGRTGIRLARNVLNSVPTVNPLKWIPLNKDGYEPLFQGDYLLCLDDGYIASVYFDGSDWELWADSGEPVAWMPLPDPYREDGE